MESPEYKGNKENTRKAMESTFANLLKVFAPETSARSLTREDGERLKAELLGTLLGTRGKPYSPGSVGIKF